MAAQFCVGTMSQLQAALEAASENAQSDTIRIVGGTLNGRSGVISSDPHTISVSGGFVPGCASIGTIGARAIIC